MKQYKEAMSLTRFGKDESVFNQYTLEKLESIAIENCSNVYYFAAIGEDKIPVIFTADEHFLQRARMRLGCQYGSIIVGFLIERAEKLQEFGNWLDDIACEATKTTTAAVYMEDIDMFFYLKVHTDSRIHIATVISGCSVYFVDGTVPICTVNKKEIHTGISSSKKLKDKNKRGVRE